MRESHLEFWQELPALGLGISFLIGIGSALFSLPLWVILLWSIYVLALRKWASLSAIFLGALYSWVLYGNLPQLEKPKECRARFSISSLQRHHTPFSQNLLYRGTLLVDQKNLPCSIAIRSKEHVSANADYWVEGKLIQKRPFQYFFKVKKWTPVEKTYSLAEVRFQTKEKLRTLLKEKLSNPRVANLLYSLSTGETEERLLRYEFSRLGLQHILAISGFHFGLLVAFFSLLFSFFIPLRMRWAFVFLFSTAYFLFIGSAPAVQRAWITTSLFFLAKWIKRPTHPANLLGGALLIELVAHPLVAANLGFQLSFASCFGILFFHRFLSDQLTLVLPRRKAVESIRLPLFSRVVCILCSWLRGMTSLMLAVNLTIFPLLLHHFGKFPLLSLLYNLFYPFLIGGSLILLLVALLCFFLAGGWGAPLFYLLNSCTSFLLDLVAYPPLVWDVSFYAKWVNVDLVLAYLGCILLAGGFVFQRKRGDIIMLG